MMENQIACTETSALVGGSQPPTPSRRLHNPGIGNRVSWLEAKTRPAIEAMVIKSLRKVILAPGQLSRPRQSCGIFGSEKVRCIGSPLFTVEIPF